MTFQPTPRLAPTLRSGTLRSSLQYDLLGHLSLQQDCGGVASLSSGTVTYSRTLGYNAKNQITSDETNTKKNQYSNTLVDTFKSITSYTYGTGATYALGSVVSQTAVHRTLTNRIDIATMPG